MCVHKFNEFGVGHQLFFGIGRLVHDKIGFTNTMATQMIIHEHGIHFVPILLKKQNYLFVLQKQLGRINMNVVGQVNDGILFSDLFG